MNLIISVAACFLILVGLLLFYIKFSQQMPYYRVNKNYCLRLLEHAILGDLPIADWHFFIGVTITHSAQLDTLRQQCEVIDEQYVTGSHLVNSQSCVLFSLEGKKELSSLLDEWRFKVDFDI
ncbi:hypothetical protein O1D97_10855 [Marinomonas sp. 15G1-11]|uniref:Uncharacterized protein n=1 Tax=Marinomonas phaeophyticola TaxID=3004091 RepID=A0ABT4JWG1_9GAMM|nr:hypothetical protein [Marinomonas sp. 15G1-11]MCZ2722133.1 hypothetical protein [Marinomonas sp. 15G1-11]